MDIAHIPPIVASAILAVVAALHVYWGFGGFWPGHDSRSLADTVVGVTKDGRSPGSLECLAIVVLLTVAALIPLAAHDILLRSIPPWATSVGLWIITVVFALRGIAGYFEHRIRPATVTLPYYRLNLFIYSPLCLLLAALLALTLSTVPSPDLSVSSSAENPDSLK